MDIPLSHILVDIGHTESTEIMPVGGQLVLKGGLKVTSTGVEKKKKNKKKKKHQQNGEEKTDTNQEGQGISVMSNKTYEEEFSREMERAKTGQGKSTPWGSGFRKAPKILHGYHQVVSGKTVEEKLDIRAAMKSDKFCK